MFPGALASSWTYRHDVRPLEGVPTGALLTLSLAVLAATASPIAIGQAQESRYEALANAPMSENRPTPETTAMLKDELLFQRATQTYLWALPLINTLGMKVGSEDAFGSGFWNLHVRCNAVRTVQHVDRYLDGNGGCPREVLVLLAVFRQFRTRFGEPQSETAIDWKYVVLARFHVPHCDHFDQFVTVVSGQILCFGVVLVQVVEFPARGVEFPQFLLVYRSAERDRRLLK